MSHAPGAVVLAILLAILGCARRPTSEARATEPFPTQVAGIAFGATVDQFNQRCEKSGGASREREPRLWECVGGHFVIGDAPLEYLSAYSCDTGLCQFWFYSARTPIAKALQQYTRKYGKPVREAHKPRSHTWEWRDGQGKLLSLIIIKENNIGGGIGAEYATAGYYAARGSLWVLGPAQMKEAGDAADQD